jgi:hypothetical protein
MKGFVPELKTRLRKESANNHESAIAAGIAVIEWSTGIALPRVRKTAKLADLVDANWQSGRILAT